MIFVIVCCFYHCKYAEKNTSSTNVMNFVMYAEK
jgi:hypothetical protein